MFAQARCGRLAENGSSSLHPACNEASTRGAARTRIEDRCYRTELPRQLKEQLNQLRNEPDMDRNGWGVLGRAAEFLVSQRGLRV